MIIYNDASKIFLSNYGQNFILLLFNPFQSEVLESFLIQNIRKIRYISYTYPIHQDVLIRLGFEVLVKKESWYPNFNTTIFINRRTLMNQII